MAGEQNAEISGFGLGMVQWLDTIEFKDKDGNVCLSLDKTGLCTAVSFAGDGSALTGVGADTSNCVKLTGESSQTIEGNLTVGDDLTIIDDVLAGGDLKAGSGLLKLGAGPVMSLYGDVGGVPTLTISSDLADGNQSPLLIQNTDAIGTNKDGNSLTISGGHGTGTGQATRVYLRASYAGSTGSTTQSDVDVLYVCGDGGKTPFGGAGGVLYCFGDINTEGKLRVQNSQTPASAGASGAAGTIAWDASYVYVCVATNTWKRAAIATW